jgi:hypothetical protein
VIGTVGCPGCGAQVLDLPETRTRADYVGSATGCWQLYTELLAREYSDIRYAAAHQLTVDAYMIQHPGVSERRSAQSVAVHLVGLCLMLERGRTALELPGLRKRFVELHPQFPWLAPPASVGELTVLDILGAASPEEHRALVDRWAGATWQAWSAHHQQVRAWADEVSGWGYRYHLGSMAPQLRYARTTDDVTIAYTDDGQRGPALIWLPPAPFSDVVAQVRHSLEWPRLAGRRAGGRGQSRGSEGIRAGATLCAAPPPDRALPATAPRMTTPCRAGRHGGSSGGRVGQWAAPMPACSVSGTIHSVS